MKKLFYLLVISAFFGGNLFLTSCQQNAKVKEKSPATTPPTTDKAQVNLPASDSVTLQTQASAPATTGNGQKFGYINSADLIKVMPETKKAEASLQAFVNGLEKQFGGLQSSYQKQVTDFQSQEKTMVDAVKQTKIKAIQDLEQQLQQSQASGQQKVAAKREELFKPILDKAEKAVKEVGKENGYDYIFDASTGSFIYAKDSHNIMPLVKTKLGIK
ncbi:OmpH family outer membrane protein [Adhaeribacter radiodurans]|uniref:OmpH family outer membrane protein n=1 Tax=Adhaeribacter radiodurans TaxID=2745197 RepID=A0A7L7L4A6_9BACT|nr:OmpH family outer membrane protein [Adhaeribacter radiodurans]QMU27637.1 OmpH family outer membrane protein [Adhaeribacter radiodurans]